MSGSVSNSVFDALDVGIIVLDERCRIVAWNDWIARATRHSGQDVLGKSLYDVFPGLSDTRLPAVIEDSLKSGSSSILTHSLNTLLPLKSESGQSLIHNIIVRPMIEGESTHCVLQVNDVTVSVTRERVLRDRQNARYHAIVDSATDAIVTTSLDRTIQWMNVATEHVFAYDPSELQGQKLDILVEHNNDLAAAFSDASNDQRRSLQVIGRPKLGPSKNFDVSFSRWIADGRVFVTTIWRDVTDQKRIEQRLRESEARYRTALAAGRMGHWETDFASGTRFWSDEGMALFGLTLANGLGHVGGASDEFTSSLHPDDRHLVQEFHELAHTQDSFPAEYRIVRPDGAVRWLSGRGQVVSRSADGKAQRLVNVVVDVTERKATEDHIQFLMREISHRSKNLLSVVQAISSQTGRTSGSIEDFHKRFSRRLQGLAASHDLLVRGEWQGAILADLVRDQLSPFVEVGGARLAVGGPDVFLKPEVAEALGMAFHELATNAVKYGALSVPTGKVSIAWSLDNEDTAQGLLRLSWVERDGPAVTAPSHKGFGHVVFERIITKSLGGIVDLDFAPEGLSWKLSMPLADVTPAQHGFKA